MPAPNPDPRTPDPAPKRVLLVRPSALGDVARTVPAAASIKAKWPDCRLEWVVNRAFVDAVRHHPAVDDAIPFDRDSPGKVWALMRELRRRKHDVVYDLQGLARSGLLTWATRARRRVGFADAREGGWLGCNVRHRVERDTTLPSAESNDPAERVWAVERMLGLLAADGVEPVEDLRLYVGGDDAAWWSARHSEHGASVGDEGGDATHGYVVLAPTAQWGCKCWPVERFAAVAERLLREGVAGRVVVVCADHEREAARAGFREALLEASRGFGGGGELWSRVLWPATTVGQLMAVIRDAALVVCNDSAALHLAVGLGAPTVSVFGPTDPALVGPWGYEVVGEGAMGRAAVTTQANPTEGGVWHLVTRAPGAADGAVDYRRHRDDDTLIRGVGVEAVWAAVARQLG